MPVEQITSTGVNNASSAGGLCDPGSIAHCLTLGSARWARG
jgi:hypothetical protein